MVFNCPTTTQQNEPATKVARCQVWALFAVWPPAAAHRSPAPGDGGGRALAAAAARTQTSQPEQAGSQAASQAATNPLRQLHFCARRWRGKKKKKAPQEFHGKFPRLSYLCVAAVCRRCDRLEVDYSQMSRVERCGAHMANAGYSKDCSMANLKTGGEQQKSLLGARRGDRRQKPHDLLRQHIFA